MTSTAPAQAREETQWPVNKDDYDLQDIIGNIFELVNLYHHWV